ncbi:MAG: bifunctional 4-hydroxy-2-oxoglutarate aldolase/2-dehydro-3-deoxy-phosphogluconate aldolase [Verrucomicrobiota bacterium]|nr:bifunctional 4-hydroxy-2-oxoglutarate aldolase/2-dehydro-3-deoxy-phosphogluconate aldolase [Verrucomicrobiota bacterium]
MKTDEFTTRMSEFGVVPVIAIDRVEAALPLADALIAGGLPVAEITFRTASAAGVIAALTRERPGLLVGAGTVLTRDNLNEATKAGARFCVAPGLNAEMVKLAQDVGIPFVPGVATPTEIEEALALGCKILKFFPAEAMGGIKMLDAIYAPYQHTGVRFVPTGGVTQANLEAYLRCKAVAAVGGTWIAKREDIASAAWEVIKMRCAAAREVVTMVRDSAG